MLSLEKLGKLTLDDQVSQLKRASPRPNRA